MRAIKTTSISILAIGLLAGSAVGVAAQDEPADPMASSTFTAEFGDGGSPEISTDPETGLDLVVISPFELADSRASGTWSQIEDFARVEDGGREYRAGGSSVRLANDGGAWVGTLRFMSSRGANGEGSVGAFTELVGEGGYEGLSLFMFETFDGDFEAGPVSNAFIVPTDMVPTMPPRPAAE